MSSEILSEAAQTNGCKEVDGKSCVDRIIPRQQLVKGFLKSDVAQTVVQLDHSHVLGELL
jgi:hypothetical protein